MSDYSNLSAEKGLIWRITHRDNLDSVFQNGLDAPNRVSESSKWVDLGNQELIGRRNRRSVPIGRGGHLSDYIPFYFTPFSPMMYNIRTGRGGVEKRPNQEIVILVSSIYKLEELGLDYVFTDRHAYVRTAQFFSRSADLGNIDWEILRSRDFKRSDEDPEKVERYQAEALVYGHMPVSGLLGIICCDNEVKREIESRFSIQDSELKVFDRPGWYFQ